MGGAGLLHCWDCRNRKLSQLSCALLCLLGTGGNMGAVLSCTLCFVQSSLNTEVCPRFHRVVFVILPEKKTNEKTNNGNFSHFFPLNSFFDIL